MSSIESEVRRALRWHTARWRAVHGDAVVGMFLDRAEADQWDRLPASDRRQLVRAGFAERFRWAPPIILGAAAVVFGVLVLVTPATTALGPIWALLTPMALAAGVCTMLISFEGRATLRLVTTLVFAIASAAALGALWWVAVYRDATVDLAGQPPVTWFWASASVYFLLVTATTCLAAAKPLEEVGIPAAAAVGTSLLGGIMCAALFAVIALVPMLQVLAGAGLVLASVLVNRSLANPRVFRSAA